MSGISAEIRIFALSLRQTNNRKRNEHCSVLMNLDNSSEKKSGISRSALPLCGLYNTLVYQTWGVSFSLIRFRGSREPING